MGRISCAVSCTSSIQSGPWLDFAVYLANDLLLSVSQTSTLLQSIDSHSTGWVRFLIARQRDDIPSLPTVNSPQSIKQVERQGLSGLCAKLSYSMCLGRTSIPPIVYSRPSAFPFSQQYIRSIVQLTEPYIITLDHGVGVLLISRLPCSTSKNGSATFAE